MLDKTLDPAVDPGRADAGERDGELYAKVTRRLVPLLLICFVMAFINRINISYAQIGMKQTLTFSTQAYAIGAGVFFVGYILFEVPSNILLQRIGMRRTLLRIMVCWGLASLSMAFVRTEAQLYLLRFLLGAFEAGFYPGVILYFTYWYPVDRRGRAFAGLATASVIGPVIAGPLSGATMKYFEAAGGLHGWQWLFILEGFPACVLGVVAFLLLPDDPQQARWLTAGEKRRLQVNLADQPGTHADNEPFPHPVTRFFRQPATYALAATAILWSGANYTIIFSIPTLIRQWGVQDSFQVGLSSDLPYLFALVGMVLIGRSSDRRGERAWHFAVASWIAAAGVSVTIGAEGSLAASLGGLCLMGIGQGALLPLFTAIISDYVPRQVAAVGIAALACVGHVGSAVSPAMAVHLSANFGTPMAGLAMVVAMFVVAGLLVLLASRSASPGGLQLDR